mmetsp:Transcript_17770/g.41381  ORF Transcript_17770/g.41381 Transcript_17770/m.41381 type:complete len:664 (-) Transcript_17770:27-2018(-)
MDGDVSKFVAEIGEKDRNTWDESTLSPAAEAPSFASETLTADSPDKSGTAAAPANRCEFVVEDFHLVQEFEKVLDLLRRHGFRSVEHRFESSSDSARVVADAQSLWSLAGELLMAYDERGKRLREALLTQRSEERQGRDSRIQALLRENAKLDQEVKALRGGASLRPPPRGSFANGVAELSSPPLPKDGKADMLSATEQRLSEAMARTKALEALVRQRERDLEQMRTRLEHAVAEDSKRQERERAILSTPLRRGAASRDNPLLEVAAAAKSKVATLEEEVLSLTKQVRSLTFQLDSAAETGRRQHALQELQAGSGDGSKSHEVARESAGGQQHALEIAAGQCRPNVAAAVGGTQQLEEVETLRKDLQHERRSRDAMQQELCTEQQLHLHQVSALQQELSEANNRAAEAAHEAALLKATPSEAQLRWQHEASRLRGELADARRAWRSADPKLLMKRDKEICDLGLDPTTLEARACKPDLVAILVEACRLLRIGSVAEVVPAITSLSDCVASLKVMEVLAQGVLSVVGDMGGSTEACLEDPKSAVEDLQRLCARACAKRNPCAAVGTQCGGGGELVNCDDNVGAASPALPKDLQTVLERLQCTSVSEILTKTECLLQLCDERMAAVGIVEAMQKLLRVSGIEEILPTLREVLDVGALRRRHSGAS